MNSTLPYEFQLVKEYLANQPRPAKVLTSRKPAGLKPRELPEKKV